MDASRCWKFRAGQKQAEVIEPSTFVPYAIALAANPVDLFYKPVTETRPEYIAAGDEVVFGKAGQETYGIGRFFSSLQNRVISGLSFFAFSVIDVKERQSYPIQAFK